MDRRVKERLIGASILVALVVLIVPELLSGPKRTAAPSLPTIPVASGAAEPMRNVTVDLATSKTPMDDAAGPVSAAPSASAPGGEAAGVEPAAEPREAGTPAGDSAASITTLRAQQPAPSAPDGEAGAARGSGIAPTGAAPAVVASSGAATHRGWAVQLGSFANKSNAESLVRRLRGDKVPVYVSSTGSGKSLRFRVRAGPLADRAAAERALAHLKKAGHGGTLVAP